MYKISNHRLYFNEQQVEYILTPNRSKNFVLKPEGIVVHDTAGRLDGATSVNWFMNPSAKASAHLVIHRDGKTTQMAPFNTKTWHAGKSNYNGRKGVNNFAVGIEIVNPGRLTSLDNGRYKSWFGKEYKSSEFNITKRSTAEHGTGWWMDYTAEQLETVEAICVTLFEKYNLQWVWPHWKVSPGRKQDTNPLFPLESLQSKLVGRHDDEKNTAIMLANTNQRRWPSYSDNVIQVLPRGEEVEILRTGWYQNESDYAEWFLVSYNNQEGWIYAALAQLN